MARPPNGPTRPRPEHPATLQFVVVAASTERLDREEKLPLYAEHGVRHAWLVDPIAKTLEAYALAEPGKWGEVRIFRDRDRVRVAPFEAIELDLAALWSGPVSG